MLTRLRSHFELSRGEKAFAAAFAIVMIVSGGLTVFVMAGVNRDMGAAVGSLPLSGWTVLAGAIGGALALYAARGWLGSLGVLGWLRAFVGGIAAALIASVIAGTLISPLYGTFYAPVLLATQFIQLPLLAVGWFAAVFGAHHLMTILEQERFVGSGEGEISRDMTASLSALSRVNLYHRTD